MNKNIIISLTKYLSLTLVLSYFLFNNIFFVIIGILMAFININKNSIDEYFKLFTHKNSIEIVNDISSRDNISKESHSKNYNLTLAQTIEELGYIPSIEKEDDYNTAWDKYIKITNIKKYVNFVFNKLESFKPVQIVDLKVI